MVYVSIFPDAPMELADTVQTKLRAAFAAPAITVVNRIPNPRPAEFVRFLGVGGVQRDRVTDVPTIAVEAWASTRSRASELAQQARAALHSLEGTSTAKYAVQEVVEFAGPGDLPDPLSDQFRYTATYAIAIRSEIAVNL